MASQPRAAATAVAIVSPDAAAALHGTTTDHHHHHRMKVSKEIVDELLLVCGVIGTTTERYDELVPVTDCLNWLQDLQRALRRDDDQYRPISLLLSQWHIVEQKLLPLVLTARYDTAMVLTVCKILVILTKPLSDHAVRAGRMAIATQMKPIKAKTKSSNRQATTTGGLSSIDITKEEDDGEEEEEEGARPTPAPPVNLAKSKKNMKEVFERVKQEQISIKQNAIQQANALVQYKQAFCRQYTSNSNKSKSQQRPEHGNNNGGVLSIFVSLLAEPLSRTGTARTDADHLTIEIVLHLFRNLLAADPLLVTSASEQLHHELILLLERELVLDILHVLAADIERRENAQYNLLLMELLQHLLRHQDPTIVARCCGGGGDNNSNGTRGRTSGISDNTDVPPSSRPPAKKKKKKKPTTTGLLLGTLQRQRQAMQAQATSRHSHFGGMLVVPSSGGATSSNNNNNGSTTTKRLVCAGRADTVNIVKASAVVKRGKETFVGASHRAANQRQALSAGTSSPLEQKSAQVIHNFCRRFKETCYGPVMKSLKNEFRRDSVRLEEGDNVVFFRIAWFFCQWWRAASSSVANDTSAAPTLNDNGLSIGHLVFTMDIYTFNLVFTAADTFMEHKKYPSMMQAVALLSEMMHVLHAMYHSKLETEQLMALGLMEHLFYSPEPLDRLPKLLSHWSPGIATRDYLCDLLHISHLTLKLLDSVAKECHIKKPTDSVTMTKKKAVAARFNVAAYFARKLVSNVAVSAFTHLLSSYDVNSATVNHRLIAFFTRMCKHVISTAETTSGDDTTVAHPLPGRASTYEPLLYNFQMLTTLEKILNDTSIRKDKDYAAMLQFASTIAYNFAVHSKKNPMLFIEILLKHPLPHRYCDEVMNLYVSDDVRLMVERDMLLDLQHNLDEKVAAIQRGDDESSDEELEFEDEEGPNDSLDDATKAMKKNTTASKRKATEATPTANNNEKRRKDHDARQNDDSSDEEDEEAKSLAARKKKRVMKNNEFKKRVASLDQSKADSGDSSDDEGIFGGTLTASTITTQRPRRAVWDTDSDDDK